MQKVTGEPAALVAATLVQAEMAIKGPRTAGSSAIRKPSRQEVVDAYQFYLALVTTGHAPSGKSNPD